MIQWFFVILFKIHIKLALNHTVIKLSSLVGLSAEEDFEILRGTDDAVGPALLLNEAFTHSLV